MTDLGRRGLLMGSAAAIWGWPGRDQFRMFDPARADRFQLSLPAVIPDESAFFASHFLEHLPAIPYVHCPSICTTPNGGMLCVWYAGSGEGKKDVQIWGADASVSGSDISWGPPRVLMSRQKAMRDLDRFVRTVGNAIVFPDDQGRVWLVFVTVAVGGWSGSSLNACCSLDSGATWQPSRRLSLSPLMNMSELVRAAPVSLESGNVGIPMYHEAIRKFPEMLWVRFDRGRLKVTKTRMCGGDEFLQPAIVPMDGSHALAYLRDGSAAHQVFVQQTNDCGQAWSVPVPLSLPNPNSSVAAVRLSTGEVLMAMNNSSTNRENMTLIISPNGIDHWNSISILDGEPKGKYAYPYLISSPGGRVDLVYTWQMQKIRHVAFNEAWVTAQPRKSLL